MKRLVIAALCFIFVLAFLWASWTLFSCLFLFPFDIIGDGIEAPLPNKHSVELINNHGYIVNSEHRTILSGVDSLQVVDSFVVGRNAESYFSLNTLTGEVSFYDSICQLKASEECDFQPMTTPDDYYWTHRKPFDIVAVCVMVIISLLSALFFTRKLHCSEQ